MRQDASPLTSQAAFPYCDITEGICPVSGKVNEGGIKRKTHHQQQGKGIHFELEGRWSSAGGGGEEGGEFVFGC